MPIRDEVLDAIEREWRSFFVELGVEFDKETDNAWCPLHADKGSKRMGFSAYESETTHRHHWKCFGSCPEGQNTGNAIDLYMAVRRLDFKTALRELAGRFNINGSDEQRKVAEYIYEDEEGTALFKVERHESELGKKFVQMRPTKSGWLFGLSWHEGEELKTVRRVPYRLPRWKDSKWVILVEGEECVLALERLGLPATTTPGGSGGWKAEYAEHFQDKKIVALPDNDRSGEAYIDTAVEDCAPLATKIRRVTLPDLPAKGDIVDWLRGGGTKEQLRALISESPDIEELAEPESEREVGISDILPSKPSNFLREYIAYAEKFTDAPPLFHVGVGYTILAAAVGRNAHYELWGSDTFPNLYTLLVGSSATTRKTTAMNLGKYVLAKAYPDAIWPSEWSFEGFLTVLQGQPVGMLFLREFSTLLHIFGRSYGEGAKPFLVDLYDCPDKIEKKLVTKEITIEGPCPTILGGTDEIWLSESLGRTGIRGGLLSRLLLFPATRHDKVKWMGIAPKIDPNEIQFLGDHLRALRNTHGTFRLSPEAEDAWNEWTKQHEEIIDSPTSHPDAASALGRLHLYALKLAGLNAIASRERTSVELEDMTPALNLISLCRKHTLRFLDELATDRDTVKLLSLRRLVRERPGITQRDAMRVLHLKKPEFQELVDTLVASGVATTSDAPRGQIIMEPA